VSLHLVRNLHGARRDLHSFPTRRSSDLVDDEQDHRGEPEQAEFVEVDRPRVQEEDLDAEDDEEHRREIELHREPPAADRLRGGVDAALVRRELGPVEPAWAGQRGDERGEDGEGDGDGAEDENRYVLVHGTSLLALPWEGACGHTSPATARDPPAVECGSRPGRIRRGPDHICPTTVTLLTWRRHVSGLAGVGVWPRQSRARSTVTA